MELTTGQIIVWAIRLATFPLLALVAWAGYAALRVVAARGGSLALDIIAFTSAIGLATLAWLGAESARVAYCEHWGTVGRAVVVRTSMPLHGRRTFGMADIAHGGVVEGHAVKLEVWRRLTPRDPIDVFYLPDDPRDFVPVASEHRSTPLAFASLGVFPGLLLAFVLAAVRSVQLLAMRSRRQKPKVASAAVAEPARRAAPAPPATTPAPPSPFMPKASPPQVPPPPPPDPTIPAWVMLASEALARRQRERADDPNDWVRVATGDRFPPLSARELETRVVVKFAALSGARVGVVVLRIEPDRQLSFESFEQWPAAAYDAFGEPVR
ncbi:MAG: hypothetical protein KF718_03685 [Polyangiaceae bacterium]|nr:hypothetical protein [Polyangiaceae bacterium]